MNAFFFDPLEINKKCHEICKNIFTVGNFATNFDECYYVSATDILSLAF